MTTTDIPRAIHRGEDELPFPGEQAPVVGRNPGQAGQPLVGGHRPFEVDFQVGGDRPGFRFCEVDGPADGLVQDSCGNAPVQSAGISLVFRRRLKYRHKLTILQLVETAFQSKRIFQAADKAHL